MQRRNFLTTLAGAAVQGAAATPSRPNFVFILMDDLGWADLSCYGSRYYETPHLDRLAKEGVRFTNAYAAAPVCSPTRASIMAGKYPARLGVTNYLPGGHPTPYSKLIGAPTTQQLALEETTIPEALAPLGYTSGHVGKWHLGGPEFFPEKQGFSVNIGGTNSGMPASFFYPGWGKNPPIVGEPGEYLTERLTKEAIRFIEANQKNPFFLYLPHYAVHVPIEAKQELIEKYRKKKPGALQNDPIYAAMIQHMDESVGQISAALERLGLTKNTHLIFTSDNGGLSAPEWKLKPVTSNSPMREGKGHLYEGGIRVPLIVRGPGVQRGKTIDTPVSSIDHLATLVDLAGGTAGKTDGVSLAALLRKGHSPAPRDHFWHYPHYSNQLGRPASAIRRGHLKLIEFHEDSHAELYDLRSDPSETKDLSRAQPETVRELTASLHQWRDSVGAKMPTPNPNYDPAREGEGYWWKTRSRP
ncbi:sulfatase [Bryobacter aggregatus]|uniref:sulfatase n=1 Tax=Bryobacter aggregatus TaxID=360054 RepID=UPI000690F4EA|nr:sulfatase [Bryobacter aggregatus]